MTGLEDFPPEERAKRYRMLAEEALRGARGAKTEDERNYFLRMAAQWEALVASLESPDGGKP